MADTYLQEAFNRVCANAKPAEGVFVSLMERCPFYGGPEEGGWWGEDHHVVAYQHFETREAAEAAKVEVERLAKELSDDARRAYGERCLRETEWLDARGLDDTYLPEPDGESEFYVLVSDGLPEESRGNRHWE